MKKNLLIGLSIALLFQLGYFLWSFQLIRQIEGPLSSVNRFHISAVKLLSQAENGFLLLEADLDKSITENLPRPTAGLLDLIRDRVKQLSEQAKEMKDLSLEATTSIARLEKALASLTERINAFQDSITAGNQEGVDRTKDSELSLARGAFRYELKSVNQLLEWEIRKIVAHSQEQLHRLLLVSLALVAAGLLGGFFGVVWVLRTIAPLGRLAKAARNISQNGMAPETLGELNRVPISDNEIGSLVTEVRRMGAAVLDHARSLEEQKAKLQRAHREVADQNEALRAAQNKLLRSEKLSLVGKMSAQMAHEIRNPLNALSLHVDLLEDEWSGSPKLRASMAPVRKEIQRLMELTENYLDLARMPQLKREEVNINSVVREVVDLFLPLAKEKEIHLTADLGAAEKVLGDSSQLVQVLSNLLKNAIESFEEVEASTRVRPRYIRVISGLNRERNRAEVTVMDSGKGIDTEAKAQVFTPFFTDKAKGNGLGLSFCRQVIEALGGEIFFDSAPGQGSKFSFALPLVSVYAESEGSGLLGGQNGKTLPRPTVTH
jgi:signal transduction histidine kinase